MMRDDRDGYARRIARFEQLRSDRNDFVVRDAARHRPDGRDQCTVLELAEIDPARARAARLRIARALDTVAVVASLMRFVTS